MNIDSVLEKAGEVGRCQVVVYTLYSALAFTTAFNHLTQVFTGGVSKYWCNLPNTTIGVSDNTFIPPDDPTTNVDEYQCMQYSNYENISSNTPLERCISGYEFDHSRYTSTIQEDFELVCDDNVKTALAQSVYFSGVLVGSIIFGSLADWIGRKPTIMICVVVQSGAGIATSFAQSFKMYTLLRFVTATAAMGIFLVDFTLLSELAGVKWRTRLSTLLGFCWSTGIIILTLVAYFVRNWRTIQLVLAVPAAFSLFYLPFLPESPRWLLSRGFKNRAEIALRKLIGKENASLPTESFLNLPKVQQSKRVYTVFDIFRDSKLRLYSLIIMFNWFVVVMVYFGISISTSGLGIDPYLVFIINGFLEYPAHFTTLILIDKYGRRRMFCLFMMTSTISCLTAGFIKPGAVLVTIVMVGKYAVTSAFGSIFVHSAEVYPTPVRSAGMGVASMAGRFGSIFSPLVPLLSYWWKPLPVLFFSCLSFLASLSCLLLPETVGRKLPQAINVYSMPIGEMAQVATEKITEDTI